MVGYHSVEVREVELPVKGKYFGKRKIRAKVHEIWEIPETGTITEDKGNLLKEFFRKKGIALTEEEIEKIRKIRDISTVDPREVDIPHPMDKDSTYLYIHGGPTENALKTLTFLQLAAIPLAAKVRHMDKFGVKKAIEQIVLPRIVERESNEFVDPVESIVDRIGDDHVKNTRLAAYHTMPYDRLVREKLDEIAQALWEFGDYQRLV